jgi:acetyl-CoA carboxylase biotin carboxyl carrier protein
MPLGKEEILEILALLEQSKFDELRLEMDGVKLVLAKGAAGAQVAEKPSQVETHKPSAPPAVTEIPPGLLAVRAPILGVFYRASAPGAPPFVEVGSQVRAEDTVCLVEVMKLFNTVKAGVAGKVVRILAENGSMVEQDQALFFIDPKAA